MALMPGTYINIRISLILLRNHRRLNRIARSQLLDESKWENVPRERSKFSSERVLGNIQ